MRMLLTFLPYIASTAVYWLNSNEFFAQAGGKLPTSAPWRMAVPVVIGGGLTPLALAAQKQTGLSFLLSATAAALVFLLAVLWLFRDQRTFLRLYRPVRPARKKGVVLGRHVLVGGGVAVIGYGALVNVLAAAN
jgi:hypothetical protein